MFQSEWVRINKTVESHKSAHPSMPPPAPPATPVVSKDRQPVSKARPTPVPRNKPPLTQAARPTIKLKIGGSVQDNGPANGTVVRAPSKPKKPPVEPTPSKPQPTPKPVKEEPKVPTVKLRTNGVPLNSNSNKGEKRKKISDAIFSDDDILASAAPLKKRPSPLLGPTPGGPSTPSPAPSQPQRNGSAVTLKLKAPKPTAHPLPPPRPEPSPPLEPVRNGKGKEPEGRGASTGPKPKLPPSAPINVKRCKDVMKMLQKLQDSAIFTRPVDPVADGCPTYVDRFPYFLPLRWFG
jgi:transcription initiation factor TFIID subunit 2